MSIEEEFILNIKMGIPKELPAVAIYDTAVNHAPKRKDILNPDEKKLALRNALRYFLPEHHQVLAKEFLEELNAYGRIYMYRFRPKYEMYARSINLYPAQCQQAAAIMLMIQNNLDPRVAQHPHELITYGGNGAVFQNWAQYLLTMQYLSEMTEEQTLTMYSGHPMGLFPSHKDAPRVVVTNGMMIPNYSKPDDWEKFNALGVTQYGQMTAGSYMYIGPQGIVHGTTITVMNAARLIRAKRANESALRGEVSHSSIGEDRVEVMLFVTAGLGGMSGAQPKAGNIAGVISVTAEVNPKAAHKRHEQGWVDEITDNLDSLCNRVKKARAENEIVSIAFIGNIVDVWEKFDAENVFIELGSDQTSLHNPWAGGYYPAGLSYEDSNALMVENPEQFKEKVQESLRRHAAVVNKLADKGMYFFDYGNAFLLEASRAGADVYLTPGPSPDSEGSSSGIEDRPKIGHWADSDIYHWFNKKPLAREMRKNPTPAEELLWQYVRNRKLGGLKFRRQHVIGPFIADFACLEKRIIIELDGDVHNKKEQMEYDENRSLYLSQVKGFKVLRFRNGQLRSELAAVLSNIQMACNSRPSITLELEQEGEIAPSFLENGGDDVSPSSIGEVRDEVSPFPLGDGRDEVSPSSSGEIRDEVSPFPLGDGRDEVSPSSVGHVRDEVSHSPLGEGWGEVSSGEGRSAAREFKYPSYVQDILGPMCFDYGFGPFRWVCCSGKEEDLEKTDRIAQKVLEHLIENSPDEIKQQLADNIKWITEAGKNKMVVGSQARILYADALGRMEIAKAFNDAIAKNEIGVVVLGRDHHDVSGTDSPYRETSNIYDGSRFTADMAVQNFVGDSFRGATWVSLHNGGGVGWGEVINGGFGMLLDGSEDCERRLKSMLHWDVNNGIARRAWARNKEAEFAINRAVEMEPKLKVTKANEVSDDTFDKIF